MLRGDFVVSRKGIGLEESEVTSNAQVTLEWSVEGLRVGGK